jgi:hypothetical protein
MCGNNAMKSPVHRYMLIKDEDFWRRKHTGQEIQTNLQKKRER